MIQTTVIKNCFKKAGFKFETEEISQIDQIADDFAEFKSICQRADVDPNICLNIDTELLACETLTDKEIIDMVVNDNKEIDEVNDKEQIIDANDEEISIISSSEALAYLNKLKDYFMRSSNDTNSEVSQLSKLEDKVLSMKMTKQTEITNYFVNNS